MKQIILIAMTFMIAGCSGLAPEAERDESNELLKPPFMEKDIKSLEQKQIELERKNETEPTN